MRILLCSPQKLTPYLGISRVLLEIHKEFLNQGVVSTLIGPEELEIEESNFTTESYKQAYSKALKKYIIENADSFDVIDYDHEFLPFDRNDFPQRLLMVTRTVLLTQHLKYIHPPKPVTARSILGKIKNKPALKKRLQASDKTILNADLINVPNTKDRELLIKSGISEEKICVIPYAFSKSRWNHFSQCRPENPNNFKIAFLGTFDYRKGACDFNVFFSMIKQQHPQATLRLIGAKGLFNTEQEILNFFDKELHPSIDIILSFEREKIGEYLSDISVGVYPSYMEGFPFGILEMSAAFIPVYAYDSPGAGMILHSDNLVPAGDVDELSEQINGYLKYQKSDVKRNLARQRAEEFSWEKVCQQTLAEYQARLE